MGAIGKAILDVLRRLYGSEFVSKTIGTRANVVKPKEFDTNAPTKNIYSKDAFRDAKLQGMVDEKIQEYAPFIFSNRNQRELMNYLDNAQKLLKQKKKDFGVTDQLKSVKINPELLKMTDDKLNALAKEGEALQAKRVLTEEERKRLDYIGNLLEDAQKLPETGKGLAEDLRAAGVKPEADVLDIKTGKKAEGIETLKEDLGLPPEVNPKTKMGGNLLELKRVTKEAELAKKDIEETTDKGLENIFRTFMQQPGKDTTRTFLEGRRRPIIRQILAEEPTIVKNLSEDDYDDLLFGKDLDKGADPNKDPFKYLDKYFVRDEDQLDMLDDIIDEMPGSTPAEISAEFKKRTGGLKPKDPDLGDKLKDLPDDIDPDAMAEGGRPGKGLDYLMGV